MSIIIILEFGQNRPAGFERNWHKSKIAATFHFKPVKLSITSLYLTLDPINVLLADRKVTPYFSFLTSKSYDVCLRQPRFVNSYDVITFINPSIQPLPARPHPSPHCSWNLNTFLHCNLHWYIRVQTDDANISSFRILPCVYSDDF